jgi:hypothetical protein
MKSSILLIFGILFLISCSKNSEDDSPAVYTTVSYDSLFLRSYDTAYYHQIGVGDSYYGFDPSENAVSTSFDVDKQNGADFRIEVSHDLFCSSPHYCFQQFRISIHSIDSNVFNVAVMHDSDLSEIYAFPNGASVNDSLVFYKNGYISLHIVGGGPEHIGNIYLGFRKKLESGEYRYGYLNMNVAMAQLYLIEAVMNTNKNECIIH